MLRGDRPRPGDHRRDHLQIALSGVAGADRRVLLGRHRCRAGGCTPGIFDCFRSLPISRAAPLLGASLADLARYLTSGVIMLALGVVLGFRTAGLLTAAVVVAVFAPLAVTLYRRNT